MAPFTPDAPDAPDAIPPAVAYRYFAALPDALSSDMLPPTRRSDAMKYTRFAALSILSFGLSLGCDSVTANEQNLPLDEEWVTVIDNVIFPYTQDFVKKPYETNLVNTLNIGRRTGSNLVNRGHVEVIYSKEFNGKADPNNMPNIKVEMRRFTTAHDDNDAKAQMEKTKLYAFTAAPSDKVPDESYEDKRCEQPWVPSPDNYTVWPDGCFLTVYYDGLTQPLRDGADLRVTVPAAWRGKLNINTSDNIQDTPYPRRSNVTVTDLAGSVEVEFDEGVANIRLADDFLEVTNCTAEDIQTCRDVGWNLADAMSCSTAEGKDDPTCLGLDKEADCAANENCVWNGCPCKSDNFATIKVSSSSNRSGNITVDMPPGIWATARLQNQDSALSPASDPGCTAKVECGDFTSCDIDAAGSEMPWEIVAELNDLGDDNIAGSGVQITAVSATCGYVEVAEDPEDWDNGEVVARGNINLCSGCL